MRCSSGLQQSCIVIPTHTHTRTLQCSQEASLGLFSFFFFVFFFFFVSHTFTVVAYSLKWRGIQSHLLFFFTSLFSAPFVSIAVGLSSSFFFFLTVFSHALMRFVDLRLVFFNSWRATLSRFPLRYFLTAFEKKKSGLFLISCLRISPFLFRFIAGTLFTS